MEKFIYYLLHSYRSSTVELQLKNSFAEKNTEQIFELKKKYYKHLARIVLESLWAFNSNQADVAKRFIIKNPEEINDYLFQSKSVLLLLGHVGNWELGQAAISHYINGPCVGVYKPLSNEKLNQNLLNLRSQFNVKLLKEKNFIKYIVENKQQPHLYIMIADQHPTNKKMGEFDFLNQPTKFGLGPEKLAMKMDFPVVYANLSLTANGNYNATLCTLMKDEYPNSEYPIIESYKTKLEKNILEAPEMWLWSHRRWR